MNDDNRSKRKNTAGGKAQTEQFETLKNLAAQLHHTAFLDAAESCGVYYINEDRFEKEEQSDLLLEAMGGLSQEWIGRAGIDAGIVAHDSETFLVDKAPKNDGPKVNCEKPFTLSLPGPWIDQSKKGWERKWQKSAISLRNTLLMLANGECENGECPGKKPCSFVVTEGPNYEGETDIQQRTMRIRAKVTIKGKCTCPKRPGTGDDGGE